MIQIKSYIIDPTNSGNLINVNNTKDLLEIKEKLSTHYLEGAIEMHYFSECIIHTGYWDYIDDLWGYILEVLERHGERDLANIYTPESGLIISLRDFSYTHNKILFCIGDREKKCYTLPKNQFFRTIINSAKNYYQKMIALKIRHSTEYYAVLDQIKKLEKKYLTQ